MFTVLGHTAAALLSVFAMGQTSSASPQVEPPVGRADVICFAVAIHLGQAGDETVKEASRLLAMYYFGRAEAQLSEPVLMAELRTVVPRISGDRWEVEKARCSEGLIHAGEQLNRSVDEVATQLGE
jgi:hypothetical protein